MGNPGSLRGSIPNCNKGSQQKQSQRMKPRKLDHGPSELTSALKVSQRWRTMTKFPWWRRTWHFAGQGSKRIEKNADKFSIFYPSNDNTPMIVTNHSPTGFWQWSPLCQKRKVCVLGLLGNVGLRFFLSFTEISRARKPIRNHQTSDEDTPTVHFVTGRKQIPTQQICRRVIQLVHVEGFV